MFGEAGDKFWMAVCLEGLAGVAAAQGQPVGAARLFGAAAALRGAIGAPMEPARRAAYERHLAATRAQLTEEAFATAWAEGRALTPEQAVAALGQAPILEQPTAGAQPSVSRDQPSAPCPAGLTAREVEVLRLVAGGLTDAQIAERLLLSPRTVHAHLRAIYGKLEVGSRSAATRYALDHNVV